MPVPVIVILSIVGGIVALALLIALIGPVFRAIGWLVRSLFWLIAHIFRFLFATVADTLRVIGAVIAAIVFIPFVLVNIVIARWSAAAHFGRSLQRELGAAGAAAYRLVIGNPARFLLLNAVTEGIEQRLPEAIAQAPGPDKPGRATGAFPGYKVVGSLRAGGSGARLFVAEPMPEKRAALARSGAPSVGQVVIKAFSVKDGATLDQIVRESRALEAARRLHLILDHELTSERFYYVTPYVPGENLSIVTQQLHARAGDAGLRGDTLRETLGYARDLVRTLDRYHGAGLWHKDIKPDNIIVHVGEAHLVDLGLVTPLASAMTLTTHGTEYFRDPEMVRMALRGVKVHEIDGVKFDIYGAGAVLYSVVENSFPAHGGLSQISKGCPEALRWVIRRSMTDLAHRYPSAAAMLADLDFIAGASDPFAVKPAQLPSMREGEVDVPEPAHEPEFAAMHAAHAATARAASPIPPRPEPARPGAQAAPAAAPAMRPRIAVLDWWTGRYSAEGVAAPGAPRAAARGNQPFMNVAFGVGQTPVGAGAPKAGPHRPAREQLKSARARVAQRQRMARSRAIGRHDRFNAGPNVGVGLAVLALLGVIGVVIVKSLESARSAEAVAPVADDTNELHVRMRAVSPRGSWTIDASGDAEMLLIDEDEPTMSVVVSDGETEELEFDAAPAAFFPRLLAGPMGTGTVAILWDRTSLDQSAVSSLHAIADLLEDGGATVVGYKDKNDDLDAAARIRSIIGVSGVDDPAVWSTLSDWMTGEDVFTVLIVEREGPWLVIDPTGQGFLDALDNAHEVPPAPARIEAGAAVGG
jgi:serine/threonine protein kinase